MSEKIRILLIEDDSDVRENVSEILSAEGYDVREASNGYEGLAMLPQLQPDLIICDIAMPGITGYDVLRTVSQSKVKKGLSFIFLTARASAEDIQEGMELGADDYILKPFSRRELLNSIKIQFRKNEAHRERSEKLSDTIRTAVPHELLTPINAISLSLGLLKEDISTMAEVQRKEILGIMEKSLAELAVITPKIVALLDLVLQIDGTKEENYSPTDMTSMPLDVVQIAVAEKEAEYQKKAHIDMEMPERPLAISDENFYRLVTEMAEFSFCNSSSTSIRVNGSQTGNYYELTLHHDATKLTAEQITKRTEFFRDVRSSRMFGNLPIGLIIIKTIALFNKGSVRFAATSSTISITCQLGYAS